MNSPQTQFHEQGSNSGATKILLALVLGSVLMGGTWSLLGPGLGLIGTWQIVDGSSFGIFRFEDDGTYWLKSSFGIVSLNLVGTYQVVKSSGDTFRVRTQTEFGEDETEYRLESPDHLIELDPENPEEGSSFTRVGDWVLALRPSESPSTYDGASPHLGCWQRQGVQTPDLELLDGGTLLRYSGGETTRATYSVDYSKVPFQFDVTDSDGQIDREIFEFAAGGALHISQTNLSGGERPKEMNRHQSYFPCPKSESRGDA